MAWDSLTDGFFKGFQFHTPVPSKDKQFGVSSQKTEKERRLQLIRYPRVNGGKVNDFGANQDVVTLEVVFFGADYLTKYNQFLKVCNDGEPGILVVPVREKALVAYFQKASEVVEVGSGKTIKVTFTFVEDTTIDPIELQPPGASLSVNTLEKASELSKKVAEAKKKLSANSFVSAMRSGEAGLSTIRRYSSAALSIDQNIRNRFNSITSNISGTLDLLTDALNLFMKPKAAQSLAQNIIDLETGQQVVPFNAVETQSTVADPLTPPTETTITSDDVPQITKNNLSSNAGVEVFSDKVTSLLKDQREQATQIGGGRIDDVSKALTQVIVSLQDFKASVAKKKGSPVVVPAQLSIMEVMFYNSVDLSKMNDVIRNNYHLDDVLVIPSGSVVYL
jgi:prophage DNA circulation protein